MLRKFFAAAVFLAGFGVLAPPAVANTDADGYLAYLSGKGVNPIGTITPATSGLGRIEDV